MDNFTETVAHLACGAKLYYRDQDGDLELVVPVTQPDGATITRLIHHGWVVSTPGCGGYELSDAGKLAYMRSTDELQSVGLVDPTGYQQ